MLEKRQGSRLPHWRLSGGVYFLTFRLGDSIPSSVIQSLQEEFEFEVAIKEGALGRRLTALELSRAKRRWLGKVDAHLDQGIGSCVLARPECAQVIKKTILHPSPHRLLAWAVMPNHVHLVVQPHAETDLSDLLQEWKSLTARRINRLLSRRGSLWQKESFEHLIRHSESLDKFIRYTLDNPSKAGIHSWPYLGSVSFPVNEIEWPQFG